MKRRRTRGRSIAAAVASAVAGLGAVLAASVSSTDALAVERGEEVEVTAGAVTALACALEVREHGDLTLLLTCPLPELGTELVVYDVAEREIYRFTKKKVFRYELESAFGGGSIDFAGKVTAIDKKTGLATVDVGEYSVNPRPKPGSFKGCL